MIVLMATGNTPIMDFNLFSGMRTLSANIAVELPEAPYHGTLYRTLFLGGMVLFLHDVSHEYAGGNLAAASPRTVQNSMISAQSRERASLPTQRARSTTGEPMGMVDRHGLDHWPGDGGVSHRSHCRQWPGRLLARTGGADRAPEGSKAGINNARQFGGKIVKVQQKAIQAEGTRDHSEWQVMVGNKEIYGFGFIYIDMPTSPGSAIQRTSCSLSGSNTVRPLVFPVTLQIKGEGTAPGDGRGVYQPPPEPGDGSRINAGKPSRPLSKKILDALTLKWMLCACSSAPWSGRSKQARRCPQRNSSLCRTLWQPCKPSMSC